MKRTIFFIAATLALLTPASHAQDINLGNYYQNLYFQTHAMMSHAGGARRVRRTAASPKWTLDPKSSSVIKRMVGTASAADRAAARTALEKILASYPALMQAASKEIGVTLRVNDTRDAATLAGVLAFQELTGKDLTKAQFIAERNATNRSFSASSSNSAQLQESGETYALAIGLMGSLKAYAQDPKNPNPDLTRQQLRGLVENTFRVAYQSADYTKFAATDKGIVKVGN